MGSLAEYPDCGRCYSCKSQEFPPDNLSGNTAAVAVGIAADSRELVDIESQQGVAVRRVGAIAGKHLPGDWCSPGTGDSFESRGERLVRCNWEPSIASDALPVRCNDSLVVFHSPV